MIFVPPAPPKKVPQARRIESFLQPALMDIIHRLSPGLYQRAQISRITVSKCRKYADIYIANNEHATLGELRQYTPKIKRMLAEKKCLRDIPALRFCVDTKLAEAIKMAQILDSVDRS
jgi:ribosome-binding factor A